MAERPQDGVVDPHGRVFDTSKSGPDAVHDGLYVADGAIVPTSLGVNPSLTIAALALRCADQVIREVDASGTAAACRDAVPVFTVVSDEAPVSAD
jgi:choline dehydrogenase-like flavoprotein